MGVQILMSDHIIKNGVRVDLTKAEADEIRQQTQLDMATKKRVMASMRKQQLFEEALDALIAEEATAIDALVSDATKTDADIENYKKR